MGGLIGYCEAALNECLAKRQVLLSSTDSLIKDLEDDNRLDRGLCVVPV